MAELHYRDGGTWRKAKELYYRDGGVWRKIKEAYYRDGGVWRKVFSGFSLTGNDFLADTDGAPGGVYNGVEFQTDGTVIQNQASTVYGAWGAPAQPGIGSSYWVRFTKLSGTGTVSSPGGMGLWQQLTSARGVTMGGAMGSIYYASVQYEIAGSSGGPVLATGSISLTADFS